MPLMSTCGHHSSRSSCFVSSVYSRENVWLAEPGSRVAFEVPKSSISGSASPALEHKSKTFGQRNMKVKLFAETVNSIQNVTGK